MNHSTESLFIFSPTSEREELVIGIIYCLLAAGNMPLYFVILYVITMDKELNSNPQYRLMNQINFVDFGQVILHFLSGIYVIFPQIQVNCQVLVRITGSTANSLWLAMFPIMSILSINRILIMREVISPKYTPTVSKILMMIGWMYTIGVWLWGCITQNFTLNGVGWSYDFTKLGAETLSALEWYLCFPSLGLTYIAYLLIILQVYTTRKGVANSSTGRQEIKIFLQSTFLCSYIIILIVMWHNAESWFKMTNVTVAVLNSAWICFSYLNPILLIALNKTIRTKTMDVIRGRMVNSKLHSISFIRRQPPPKTRD